jgi:hypothetical protein
MLRAMHKFGSFATAASRRIALTKSRGCRPVVALPASAATAVRSLSSSTNVARKSTRGSAAAAAAASSGGSMLAALRAENPHTDVVQYHHKNRTWSIHHVDYYSEALAIGLAENGLIAGDVVLSWLPQHFADQVRTVQYSTSIYMHRNITETSCVVA